MIDVDWLEYARSYQEARGRRAEEIVKAIREHMFAIDESSQQSRNLLATRIDPNKALMTVS